MFYSLIFSYKIAVALEQKYKSINKKVRLYFIHSVLQEFNQHTKSAYTPSIFTNELIRALDEYSDYFNCRRTTRTNYSENNYVEFLKPLDEIRSVFNDVDNTFPDAFLEFCIEKVLREELAQDNNYTPYSPAVFSAPQQPSSIRTQTIQKSYQPRATSPTATSTRFFSSSATSSESPPHKSPQKIAQESSADLHAFSEYSIENDYPLVVDTIQELNRILTEINKNNNYIDAFMHEDATLDEIKETAQYAKFIYKFTNSLIDRARLIKEALESILNMYHLQTVHYYHPELITIERDGTPHVKLELSLQMRYIKAKECHIHKNYILYTYIKHIGALAEHFFPYLELEAYMPILDKSKDKEYSIQAFQQQLNSYSLSRENLFNNTWARYVNYDLSYLIPLLRASYDLINIAASIACYAHHIGTKLERKMQEEEEDVATTLQTLSSRSPSP